MIKVLKIVVIILLGCMAVYHVLPYSNTYTNILYYFSDHGLKVALLLFIWHKYKGSEFLVAAILFFIKMVYHISLLNEAYSDYLDKLKSEYIASFLTICLLIYFIIKHEQFYRKKL